MKYTDLERLVRGEVTEEEKKDIIDWIRKDPVRQKEYNRIKAQYVASEMLHNIPNKNLENIYQEFKKKRSGHKNIFYVMSGLAAVLIFSFFYLNKEYVYQMSDIGDSELVNVSTAAGDNKIITLSDGSIVTLNAESRLIFSKSFKGNTRTVKLKGEAFFDVKRDTGKPFIVETDNLKIKVLGTSFNVKSYPNDLKIETTLTSGKVEVIHDDKMHPVTLKPSQKAIYHKAEKKVRVEKVEPEIVSAWKYGKLIFNQTTLKNVIKDIERKYGVNITVESDSLLQYEFTGTFDNLTLNEALQLFETSSAINYELKNKEVIFKKK